MRSFTLITALLLCSLGWISASVSETQTVEVQSGEEVTLLCSNISTSPTQTDWFRVVEGTKPSCISSMFYSGGEASPCHGFDDGFEMSSNTSTVFLKIKQVKLSDSGLYFCGLYMGRHTVIADAIRLNVQGNGELDDDVDFNAERELDGTRNLMTVILGGLTVFFSIAVTVLTVKIRKLRKLQKAADENLHPERNKNLVFDNMNSTELQFLPETIRSRKTASEREVETHVIYAASR